jgi:hypothetical protein
LQSTPNLPGPQPVSQMLPVKPASQGLQESRFPLTLSNIALAAAHLEAAGMVPGSAQVAPVKPALHVVHVTVLSTESQDQSAQLSAPQHGRQPTPPVFAAHLAAQVGPAAVGLGPSPRTAVCWPVSWSSSCQAVWSSWQARPDSCSKFHLSGAGGASARTFEARGAGAARDRLGRVRRVTRWVQAFLGRRTGRIRLGEGTPEQAQQQSERTVHLPIFVKILALIKLI